MYDVSMHTHADLLRSQLYIHGGFLSLAMSVAWRECESCEGESPACSVLPVWTAFPWYFQQNNSQVRLLTWQLDNEPNCHIHVHAHVYIYTLSVCMYIVYAYMYSTDVVCIVVQGDVSEQSALPGWGWC